MKYFLLILSSIALASCNNSGSEQAILKAAWERNLEDYNQRLNSSRIYINDEPELNAEVNNRMNYLDSLFRLSKSQLEANPDLANEIVSDFSKYINTLFTDQNTFQNNTIPKGNSLDFGMVELTRLAEQTLSELTSEVGASDMKFDQFKIFVESSNAPIKLGQELNGIIYLGLYSTLMESRLNFIMNGDTLNTKSGSANFIYRPKRRGMNKIRFEVTANYPSLAMENIKLEEEIEVYVE